MDRSEQIHELAAALSKAQSEMTTAAKDSTNPHFKSKYADLASVWEAVRAPLTRHGLSISQLPEDGPPGTATITTILMHSSGQYIATRTSVKMVKEDAQAYGSAIKYLRRYSLEAVAGVAADEEDDDGNAASGRPSISESRPKAAMMILTSKIQSYIDKLSLVPSTSELETLIVDMAANVTEETQKAQLRPAIAAARARLKNVVT